MRINQLLIILLVFLSFSCQKSNKNANSLNNNETISNIDSVNIKEETHVEDTVTIKKSLGTLNLIGNNRSEIGKVKKGDIISQKYKMVNIGKETVEILNYRRSCNCTDTKISSMTIEPKDSVEVEIIVETEGKNLGRHKIDITLETNGQTKFYYFEASFDLIES